MSNGNRVEQSIDGTTRFTAPLGIGAGSRSIMVYVKGTWSGKLTIQFRLPGKEEFESLPTDEYTENFDTISDKLPINSEVRVGFVLPSDYVFGTANVIITK